MIDISRRKHMIHALAVKIVQIRRIDQDSPKCMRATDDTTQDRFDSDLWCSYMVIEKKRKSRGWRGKIELPSRRNRNQWHVPLPDPTAMMC